MPRFNTSNDQVIKYLCDVALYWVKELNIDGYRLDVADEVSHKFWQEFRRTLKNYDNNIIIIGEVWNHASKWLQGDEFDTVTNYKYRKWMLDFAKGEINSTIFWNKINTNYMLYKTNFNNYMINLLGSHDTIRCSTYLGNKCYTYLSMIITITMQGIPLIYYGDEYAQEGFEDPDNRRAMQWDKTINNKFLENVKKIAKFRNSSDILKKGNMKSIFINERTIAFKRIYHNDCITIIANYGEEDIFYNENRKEILFGEGILENDGIIIKKENFVILGDK